MAGRAESSDCLVVIPLLFACFDWVGVASWKSEEEKRRKREWQSWFFLSLPVTGAALSRVMQPQPPPVDPGSTIRWATHPLYSSSLLTAINHLPSRPTQHSLFQPATGKSTQWKTAKQAALASVTKVVFSNGGDAARGKKQQESVQRRLNQYVLPSYSLVHSPSTPPTRDRCLLAVFRPFSLSFFCTRRTLSPFSPHADSQKSTPAKSSLSKPIPTASQRPSVRPAPAPLPLPPFLPFFPCPRL